MENTQHTSGEYKSLEGAVTPIRKQVNHFSRDGGIFSDASSFYVNQSGSGLFVARSNGLTNRSLSNECVACLVSSSMVVGSYDKAALASAPVSGKNRINTNLLTTKASE